MPALQIGHSGLHTSPARAARLLALRGSSSISSSLVRHRRTWIVFPRFPGLRDSGIKWRFILSTRPDSSRRFHAASLISSLAGVILVCGPASAQTRPQVTFTKDVAPILQRSCVTCHRPGQSAPMSLRTYEEVRPWASSIRTRVSAREMPPWHIDRNVGIQEFKKNLSLADKDIETIVAWVDAGAPAGNPADMPAQRQFADGDEWAIGKPDLVVRFPAYKVPAAGPDLFPNINAPTGLTEDRY